MGRIKTGKRTREDDRDDIRHRKEIDNRIIKHLRKAFLQSRDRNAILKKSKRRVPSGEFYADGREKMVTRQECASCRKLVRHVQCDHIEEVGPFLGDWNDYIKRMLYTGEKGLQALCEDCHDEKTKKFKDLCRSGESLL